jgi:hypothetical protein
MMRSQLLLPALFLYMLLLTFFLQVWLKRRQHGLTVGVARRPWDG